MRLATRPPINPNMPPYRSSQGISSNEWNRPSSSSTSLLLLRPFPCISQCPNIRPLLCPMAQSTIVCPPFNAQLTVQSLFYLNFRISFTPQFAMQGGAQGEINTLKPKSSVFFAIHQSDSSTLNFMLTICTTSGVVTLVACREDISCLKCTTLIRPRVVSLCVCAYTVSLPRQIANCLAKDAIPDG